MLLSGNGLTYMLLSNIFKEEADPVNKDDSETPIANLIDNNERLKKISRRKQIG